jgi:hypothetical protein
MSVPFAIEIWIKLAFKTPIKLEIIIWSYSGQQKFNHS